MVMQLYLWTHLWHLNLCQPKCLRPVTKSLLYSTLSLHIQLPIFLPLRLLSCIKQRWSFNRLTFRKRTVILINKRQPLSFFLCPKHGSNFNLSPNKRSLLHFISNSPPSSSLHNPFNKIRIITRSHINFKFSLILLNRFNYKSIRKTNLP